MHITNKNLPQLAVGSIGRLRVSMKAKRLNYGDEFWYNHMHWRVRIPTRHYWKDAVQARTKLPSGKWWLADIHAETEVKLKDT